MAAASGISPNQETLAQVEELRKNNSKYFFATFKVDGVEIVPDVQYGNAEVKALTEGALTDAFKATVWPEFVKTLTTANGPRFGVIDFAYTTKDGRNVKSLVSVGWCPDKGTAPKLKMTFASTKTAFEVKINIGKKYQANDEADLEFREVFESIQKL